MNILHVIPGLTHERGGPSVVVEALSRCQADAGHSVYVLTSNQGISLGEHPVELADDVEVERLPIRGPDRWAYSPQFSARLRRRLTQCDLVHVHSLFSHPTDAACRWAHRLNRPCILAPCGSLDPRALASSRWKKRLFLSLRGFASLRTVSAIHCATSREEELSRPQFDPAPSFVVPNGVWAKEYEGLDRSAARETVAARFGLHDSPFILFLGRLHPDKGLDILLPAFCVGAPASYRLVIAGPADGDYGQRISALSLELGLENRVIFTGLVQGQTKRALLSAADLFVLPSRHENFGIVVIESLAAGTPVLLSDQVDLFPDVCRAEVGWSCPLTIAQWASHLADLLARPQDLLDLRNRASQWACTEFDWPSVNRRLEEHYASVVAGCGAVCQPARVLS